MNALVRADSLFTVAAARRRRGCRRRASAPAGHDLSGRPDEPARAGSPGAPAPAATTDAAAAVAPSPPSARAPRRPHEHRARAGARAGRCSAPGDEGAEVRDLQARLKQIDWFDGRRHRDYGDVTTEAVRGFQAKREIPVTGEVDQRTLDRLHAHDHRADPGRAAQPARRQRARRPRPALHDRPGAVHRQVQPHAALGRRRQGAEDRRRPVRRPSTRRPARASSASTSRAATTCRSSTARSMPFAMFFSGGQAVHYSSDFAARRLRRRLARLRQHPRLRRHRLALRPGAGRRQGRRLLVVSQDQHVDRLLERSVRDRRPKVRSPSPSWH